MNRPLTTTLPFAILLLTVSATIAQPLPKGTTVKRDLVYATVPDVKASANGEKVTMPLKLDLYIPKAKGDRRPGLVVWIHGGGWRNGSKDRCGWTWLTGYGYAVASIQYRLTDKAPFPAQIHDCKGAIRWLRAHADAHGYDAGRIGLIGISAGGHLVTLLGTSGGVKELEGDVGGNLDRSSRVQAVVNMCGPSDFIRAIERKPRKDDPGQSVHLLLDGTVDERPDRARAASPVTHITDDDAPLRIVHGDADKTVELDQSQHLHDLYKQAGLEVTLDVVKGGNHVPGGFWDKDRRKAMLAFFAAHLRGKN